MNERFEQLMNQYSNEQEALKIAEENGHTWPFSDEEILFMSKYNLGKFGTKYPNCSYYYMYALD